MKNEFSFFLFLCFHLYSLIILVTVDSYLKQNIQNSHYFSLILFILNLIYSQYQIFYMQKNRGFISNDNNNASTDNFYCDKCKIFIPLRASHCSFCKHCIQRRDHHCTILGICIGRMNHKSYMKFVFSELSLLLQILLYSFHPALIDYPLNIWLMTSFQCFLLIGISSFFIIQLLRIIVKQSKNIMRNETVWEKERRDRITYLRDWPYEKSPFSKGYKNNIKEFIQMDKIDPQYFIPQTYEEIKEWENNNLKKSKL